MSVPALQLPTIQNWSCHNCGGCCRQHVVEVTQEEHRRIQEQNWGSDSDFPAGAQTVVPMGGGQMRLAQQPDGACVFLDSKGLCRIHAKFGEAAKPLACRIYPWAFHPAGRLVAVSLRFSCPSVVASRGRPAAESRNELRDIVAEVVPDNIRDIPPPRLHSRESVDWSDFLRIRDTLDSLIAVPGEPVIVKLLRALFVAELVGQSKFKSVRGARLSEFLDVIRTAACSEIDSLPIRPAKPAAVARVQFRLLVAQYARRDTAADLTFSLRHRWNLLRRATRFARGRGLLPESPEATHAVSFHQLEYPFGGLPDDAEEILTRYLRVKIQGIHFCGRAYYDAPFVEGFCSLAMVVAGVLYLARWRAAAAGRDSLVADDVCHALATADHNHGFSRALGLRAARRRIRQLARLKEISRLCVWYSR